MSRHKFTNQWFDVILGVDHVTSAFIQVNDRRNGEMDDKDEVELVIDNQGVQERTPIIEVHQYLDLIKRRFQMAAHAGTPFPNLDSPTAQHIMFLLRFDVDLLEQKIWNAFDAPHDAPDPPPVFIGSSAGTTIGPREY